MMALAAILILLGMILILFIGIFGVIIAIIGLILWISMFRVRRQGQRANRLPQQQMQMAPQAVPGQYPPVSQYAGPQYSAQPSAAAPAPMAPSPAPPVPSAQPAAPFCTKCGKPTTYIPQYGRYYCYTDNLYA